MKKIELILKKIIKDLIEERKIDDVIINNFLKRVYIAGKFYELKRALKDYETDLKFQNNIVIGDLECCQRESVELIKEKLRFIFNKEIELSDIKINNNLILGGIFRTNNLELNFSLISLLKKWMTLNLLSKN